MKVIMSGFGYTGSSAFNALLSEVDGFVELEDEIRFLVDPDGLVAAEAQLREAWNPFVADSVIKRLESMLLRLGKHKRFPYYNQDHNKNISETYNQAVHKFLSKLKSSSFKGMWLGINDPWEYQRRHIKNWTKGLVDFQYKKDVQFIDSSDTFLQWAKEFVEDVFSPFNKQDLMIDESFTSINSLAVLKFFSQDTKVLISERDPRDVYYEIIQRDVGFIPHDPEIFIQWYKAIRNHAMEALQDPRVKMYRFEDLILNYEETVKAILDFLEIDISRHSKKLEILKPQVSRKNIGKWKNFSNQGVMSLLGEKLHNYCYES